MSMIQALAMTVAEIPVFLYTTFGQVQVGWVVVLPFNHLGPETWSRSAAGTLGPRDFGPGVQGLLFAQSREGWDWGPGRLPGLYLPSSSACADRAC